MRLINRVGFVSGLGVLFLVNSFSLAGLVKAEEISALSPKLSANAKMGGILTFCHLERIKQTSDPTQQLQSFDRLFDRYQKAKQDRLILQLVKGMDRKQFPQLQAEELMQVAYRYRTTAEPKTAIPLLSQAFQLLQSVNDDLPMNLSSFNTYQYIWRTTRYHQDKAQLLENLGGNLIDLKQPEQAEAALLQALQTYQKQPHLSPRDKVEYMVKIAKGLFILDKHEQAIAMLDRSLEITQLLNHTKESRDSKDWLTMLSKLSWEYRLAGENRKADLLFNQSLEYADTFSQPDSRVFVLSIIAEVSYSTLSQYELNQLPIAQKTTLIDARQTKLEYVFGKILEVVRSGYTAKMYPNTALIAGEWLQFLGIEPAMKIVNSVTDPVERFEVISPMLKSRNTEIAQKDIALLVPLLKNAEAIARTIQPTTDRDRAWGDIAFTYAQLGQSPKALEAITQIQSAELKQKTLIGVAVYLAQANQPELALSLVKGLPDTLVQQVLYEAMLAYLKNGKIEVARGLQGRLFKDYHNSTLTSLAEASAKVGQTKQALMLLQQVPEPEWRSGAFVSIIKQAIEVGDLDRAVVFAQQMPESEKGLPDIPSKAWMLEEIAIAYAEAGEYDKAMQLSQSLPDRSLSQLVDCAKRSK
ncbi:tetratricopeptide repeat protein [Tumidithrix elongata RA019]|uniref:Tetratricopeptide repeat protein n=1 Tax=Tumidithrix elongata BACA0141 TaxID=2716417 RepID=A0AAW9Q0J2_9CYAN|nr:tetratricopeptide repeat protein [Tumidithrix elongata RA019]